MLFYYFKSKKGLYLFLIDYAITIMVNEYFNLIDTKETDFIERFRWIAQIKLKYYNENPNVSNFISTVYLNQEFELPEHINKQLAELERIGYEKVFGNVNKTLFRSDINADKAFQLIRWSLEGYQQELLSKFEGKNIALIDLKPYWDDFYDYLSILKTTFYKEED